MSKLRPIQRAYIAGFFDGEGCVSIPPNNHPRLIFTQRDPEVLRKIQEMLGYGNLNIATGQGLDHGQCWKLSIHRTDCVYRFIHEVLPYAIVKRKKLRQARRIIEQNWMHLVKE